MLYMTLALLSLKILSLCQSSSGTRAVSEKLQPPIELDQVTFWNSIALSRCHLNASVYYPHQVVDAQVVLPQQQTKWYHRGLLKVCTPTMHYFRRSCQNAERSPQGRAYGIYKPLRQHFWIITPQDSAYYDQTRLFQYTHHYHVVYLDARDFFLNRVEIYAVQRLFFVGKPLVNLNGELPL